MNSKKLLIPVAVILVAALIIFGANAALAGTAATRKHAVSRKGVSASWTHPSYPRMDEKPEEHLAFQFA